MDIFDNKNDLKSYILTCKDHGKTIGFVPTMGALHEGHLSLIKNAITATDVVIVSIFVNPTQFDNQHDLDAYPITLNEDVRLLHGVGCNVLYMPSAKDVYDGAIVAQMYSFDGLEHQMEGKFRSGHFDGVGTVVKRLFDITKPDIAFFGEKDFQQLQIIKKLVKKEGLEVKVKGCSIYREDDGLAMSSRNVRLSLKHRKSSPMIYDVLKKAKQKFIYDSVSDVVKWVEEQFSENKLLDLEYFTIANEQTLETVVFKDDKLKCRAFIAVYAGDIRLIDNIRL